MSSYYQIFVGKVGPEERLVADVAAAAGREVRPVGSGDGGISYAGEVDRVAVEIELSHEFEDDMGIAFSRYPVVVTFRSYDRDRAREKAVAERVFEGLKGDGSRALVLVFGLAEAVDTYDP
ncbi:hypothetical protein [Actinomadura rubrisoli]|uniref:Uncharacterized protein n=1 Tax=Actinomadura rubrisoli TaxID=2530368 RepID=A0A4R5A3K9_9ACTN|nr:hypothetical protein [Actinomadura rubrisoli]TDD65600.1 hypothetical protein E1298_41210 [Actinomadura rubrisoli]